MVTKIAGIPYWMEAPTPRPLKRRYGAKRGWEAQREDGDAGEEGAAGGGAKGGWSLWDALVFPEVPPIPRPPFLSPSSCLVVLHFRDVTCMHCNSGSPRQRGRKSRLPSPGGRARALPPPPTSWTSHFSLLRSCQVLSPPPPLPPPPSRHPVRLSPPEQHHRIRSTIPAHIAHAPIRKFRSGPHTSHLRRPLSLLPAGNLGRATRGRIVEALSMACRDALRWASWAVSLLRGLLIGSP